MARYASIGCEQAPSPYGVGPSLLPAFEGRLDSGSITADTATFRSGLASWKIDSGAGQLSYITHFWGAPMSATSGVYLRVYVRMTSLPGGTTRLIVLSTNAAYLVNAQITSAGKLQLFDEVNVVQIGSDSAATMVVGQWYRVELYCKPVAGAGVDEAGLMLDGVSVASSTALTLSNDALTFALVGQVNNPGASIIWHVDDVAINDGSGASHNTYPGDGKVVYMLPTSDNARGANWVAGAGATTSLHDAVNNMPPICTSAASQTNATQIKNANGADTTGNYDANMATYTAAGIGAADTIRLVQSCAVGGSTTTLYVDAAQRIVSNPAQGADDTSQVGLGTAIAAYPDYWEGNWGVAQVSPAVTLGTSPVVRVGRRGTQATELHYGLMVLAAEYVSLPPLFPTIPQGLGADR